MTESVLTKMVGLVSDQTTEDAPHGAFEVVLSAPTLDRDGEVIDARAFEPLPDHVPFDIDHGMTVTTTIGSGQPYYADDGSLRVKGTYASTPLAQEVRTLVTEGHVRTTSVTFMAANREKDEKGVMHVRTAELLNGTFTPVPSNREAVVLSAKSVAAATEDKPVAVETLKAVQTMHDASVALGAACEHAPTEAITPDADTKSAYESAEKSAAPAADNSADESADAGSEAKSHDWDQAKSAAAAAFAD